MKKNKIVQFRFFGDNNYPKSARLDSNYPIGLTSDDLTKGIIFNKYRPIILLRISTLPGVKFNLCGNYSPLVVGVSGVYEVNQLQNIDPNNYIVLTFERDSLDYLNINPDGYLIIDIVYEEG